MKSLQSAKCFSCPGLGLVMLMLMFLFPLAMSERAPSSSPNLSRFGRIRTESAPSTCDCKKSRAKTGFQDSLKYLRRQRSAQFRDSRIIKGVEALPGEFPWQARIEEFNLQGKNEWDHLCGGSLVSSRHVITASHCLKTNKESLRVILGVHDRRNKTSYGRFNVIDYVTHRFGSIQYDNDIAIMTIEDDKGDGVMCDDNIQPICLKFPPANEELPSTAQCFVSGYGLTEKDQLSDVLLYTKIEPQSRAFCQKLYNGPRLHDQSPDEDNLVGESRRFSKKISSFPAYQSSSSSRFNYNRFTPGMLCAGPVNGGADTCTGDSGGPFACLENDDFYLTGITSWGIGCGTQPSIYTRISEYKDWIETEMALTGVN